ncbi:MAG: hypothetical protein U0271_09895 [Polyangiaceae bacterium]
MSLVRCLLGKVAAVAAAALSLVTGDAVLVEAVEAAEAVAVVVVVVVASSGDWAVELLGPQAKRGASSARQRGRAGRTR